MGKPRTATAILEARGAFKNHPERKRKNEPKPAAAFPVRAPTRLTQEQKACWRQIVNITPPGVLANSDQLIVEVASCLLAEYRANPNEMVTARITRLTSELGKLGLSPSDRAGLEIPSTKPNRFDEF